jgi:hypothetical protein
MNKTLISAALVATTGFFAASAVTAAERISYDYVGAQFIKQHIDDANCNPDGLSVYGSASLNNDIFVVGSVSDVSGGHCGLTNLQAAIGYHTLFGADSSIYGLVGVDYSDIDHGGDDNGLMIAAGLRGFVADNLEGKVEVSHHTIFDGNTALTGGISYWLNRNVALHSEVSLGTDITTATLGARFHF